MYLPLGAGRYSSDMICAGSIRAIHLVHSAPLVRSGTRSTSRVYEGGCLYRHELPAAKYNTAMALRWRKPYQQALAHSRSIVTLSRTCGMSFGQGSCRVQAVLAVCGERSDVPRVGERHCNISSTAHAVHPHSERRRALDLLGYDEMGYDKHGAITETGDNCYSMRAWTVVLASPLPK